MKALLPWQELTDMLDTETTAIEMNKKYKNTILCVSYQGKDTHCTYNGYRATDDGKFQHLFNDAEGNKIVVNHDTEVKVTIPNPKRGLYNTWDGIVLFQRLPFRQHKRGLYNETAIITLIRKVLGQAFAPANSFNETIFDVLDHNNQRRVSIDTAKTICNEQGNWAMNREFGLMLHPQQETGYILLYEDCYVGDVVGHEILVKNPVFFQEVLDSYRDWAPNYTVRLM